MSYDVFIHRFEEGESAPLDMSVLQEVLSPYVTARHPETGLLQIAAKNDGGEADVYVNGESSITINHFGGDVIMNVISEMLRRLGAVLILPGGTVIVDRDEDRCQLPSYMRNEWSVIVAPSGEEITRAIRAS
ncbi:hypothetical protein [Streptomyces cyaneogriseus]|uniref:hypothetical protein n=1 Tax=Streptomyces cyaneogriseus TaxID=68192 RepID=UPI0013313CBC|nr:hypothetical protein [Streptomyces cyaneogriseus]